MESTDQFSARAAVLGVILLAVLGAVGTVWLYAVGHGDQAKDFGVTIAAVSAPVAALARITKATVAPGPVTQQVTLPAATDSDVQGFKPA